MTATNMCSNFDGFRCRSPKVATHTQSTLSAIFPYVHLCLTTGQEYWHSSIC